MMSSTSRRVRKVCTPPRWVPSIGGTTGSEPVASTHTSYGVSAPVQSRTIRRSRSTATTSRPARSVTPWATYQSSSSMVSDSGSHCPASTLLSLMRSYAGCGSAPNTVTSKPSLPATSSSRNAAATMPLPTTTRRRRVPSNARRPPALTDPPHRMRGGRGRHRPFHPSGRLQAGRFHISPRPLGRSARSGSDRACGAPAAPGSVEEEVALQLPVGDVSPVLLPLDPLRLAEALDQRRAQALDHGVVLAQRVEGLDERAGQRADESTLGGDATVDPVVLLQRRGQRQLPLHTVHPGDEHGG